MKAAMEGNRSAAQTLIGALFIMVVTTMAMAYVLTRMNIQQREALWRLESLAAFHAAEAGIAHAVSRLRANPDWRLGEAPELIELRDNSPDGLGRLMGFYSLEVAAVQGVNPDPGSQTAYINIAESYGQDAELPDPARERWIRAVGWDALMRRERGILVKIRLQSPTDFMTATLGTVRVESGADIGSDIFGRDVFFSEVEDGGAIVVNGNVVYLGSIQGHNQPEVEITGTTQVSRSLSFANLDMANYRQIAQDNAGVGGTAQFFSAGQTIDLGAVPDGVNLIYVQGDARIQGQYNRSITVVAEGDMFITGDITALPASGAQLGLLASQDVIIPEDFVGSGGGKDLTIEAFVMADGQGDSSGVFRTAGPDKQHDGILTFIGAMTARGKGLGKESAIVMSGFIHPRVYTYNTEFRDNRSIPYLPLSVNLRSWRQTRLGDPFPPGCLYFRDDEEGDSGICAD